MRSSMTQYIPVGDIVANVEGRIQPFVGQIAGWLGLANEPPAEVKSTKRGPAAGTTGSKPTMVNGTAARFNMRQTASQIHYRSDPCLAAQKVQLQDAKLNGR